MAFIAQDDDEDLKKQQAGGINTSGVVGANTTGAPTASGTAPGANAAAPTSTGFVNLQSYLDANPGAGAKLAGDATKDLTNQVGTYGQTVANTLSGAKSGFAASTGDDQAAQIKSGLKTDANGTAGQAKSFLGANYTGPKADDYTGALKTTQGTLDASLGKVDNAANQQDLLTGAYGGAGGYGSGFKNLDQLLIGGQQGGRDVINGVKAQTANVDGNYSRAAASLGGMEQAAKTRLASNQAGVKNTAKDVEGNIVNVANPLIAQKNATLNADNINTSKASIGDVLTDKNRLDLKALQSLTGDPYNDAWDHGTFNAGTARPAPLPPPVTGDNTGNAGSVTGVGKAGAAIAKGGGDISDTTKIAGNDAANSFKQPSNPVAQAPSPLPSTQGVINTANHVGGVAADEGKKILKGWG